MMQITSQFRGKLQLAPKPGEPLVSRPPKFKIITNDYPDDGGPNPSYRIITSPNSRSVGADLCIIIYSN